MKSQYFKVYFTTYFDGCDQVLHKSLISPILGGRMKLKQTFLGFATFAALVSSSLAVAPSAHALECTVLPDSICGKADNGTLESSGTWALLIFIIQLLTAGVGLVAVGMIAYASFLYTTAQSDESQTKQAKEMIRNVVVGLLVYAFMWAAGTVAHTGRSIRMIRQMMSAFLITASLAGVVAVASPAQASAACGRLVTFPAWYNGLTDKNCELKPVGQADTSTEVTLKTFIVRILMNIIEMILQLVAYAAVVMLIIGGFQYITSTGDSGNMSNAKKTILNSIIGLIISLFSVAIVNIIANAF